MNSLPRLASGALLIAFLVLAKPSQAAVRAECISVQSKILARSVPYCVLLPPSYDVEKTRRYPVLYLLHGLGDDEQMLIHSGGMNLIQDLWERNQIGDFLIVTPAAGASFYINSHDGHQRYEDFLLQELFPAVGKRYRAQAGQKYRGIAGISMGGYGALHLAFAHPALFGSVGAHSAALIEKLPALKMGDSRQSARLRILGGAFGVPFDPAFWKQNDPVTIAGSANLAGLKIYFDCGSEDDYGFETGAQDLDRLLTSRHIGHEFHLYPGGHNWAYVAEHLPALLQFHSRVFEATTPAQPKPHSLHRDFKTRNSPRKGSSAAL